MNAHLTPAKSDRGFTHLLPIQGVYGSDVRVYESSAASGPHVWLKAGDTTVHLTAEGAWRLADQLRYLVRNHYQGDATPAWVNTVSDHPPASDTAPAATPPDGPRTL